MKIETLIGIAVWVVIFLVWYFRTYPEKFPALAVLKDALGKWYHRSKATAAGPKIPEGLTKDYRSMVETVESICAKDKMGSSDAASMVLAAQRLVEIEPATGQIWEAFALDSLETAHITCDDCRVPVEKIVKKTGVRIVCPKCGRWLALKNSKVTVIDPNRPDLEDWEH